MILLFLLNTNRYAVISGVTYRASLCLLIELTITFTIKSFSSGLLSAIIRVKVQSSLVHVTETVLSARGSKLLSDDPGSANLGGDLGWSGPGTFVPEFETVVDSLELGIISEPFRFFKVRFCQILGF